MDKKDGLRRLLDFLALLNSKNIWFRIEQTDPESVMVSLTLVGARVEVNFFESEVQYSVFTGSEDVALDEAKLRELIEQRG